MRKLLASWPFDENDDAFLKFRNAEAEFAVVYDREVSAMEAAAADRNVSRLRAILAAWPFHPEDAALPPAQAAEAAVAEEFDTHRIELEQLAVEARVLSKE